MPYPLIICFTIVFIVVTLFAPFTLAMAVAKRDNLFREKYSSNIYGSSNSNNDMVKAAIKTRKLSSTQNEAVPLDMDCGDQTGYSCMLYIQNFLNTYVNVNRSYDKTILPVETNSDILDIEIVITFADLVDVDIIQGTMTTSIHINYLWKDAHMTWNSSLTDGVDFIPVPLDLLWMPDIQIYNAIGGFNQRLDVVTIELQSDGTMWWAGRGVVTFSCEYDLKDFPFDSQLCSPAFASWLYSLNYVNISKVGIEVGPDFNNLAWNIDSVEGYRELVPLFSGEYIYTFGIYNIAITRYYNYYMASAILPALLITCVVLCSLWMHVYITRLSLCVTGMLTMTAIQWSVASALPVAEHSNWLSNFLTMCNIFIAVVCIECYVVNVISSTKHNEHMPQWAVGLIQASLCQWHAVCQDAQSPKHQDNAEGIELHSHESTSTSPMAPTKPPMSRANPPSNDSAMAPVPPAHVANEYTWERSGRALDRICRLLIPAVFLVIVAVMLGKKLK